MFSFLFLTVKGRSGQEKMFVYSLGFLYECYFLQYLSVNDVSMTILLIIIHRSNFIILWGRIKIVIL